MKESQLIFCFIRQPVTGLTLEAFIVKLLDNQTFSYEYQRVIYERRDDYNYPFTDIELQVIKKLADLTPQAVERLFNKKKIKKELFLDKLSKDEEQMKLLNAYFDKKIAGCLNLLRGQQVYWRVKASDHPGMLPYPVHAHALKMVYHFTKVEEGIEYALKLFDGEKLVKPTDAGTQVLCSEAGWLMHQTGIYSLSDGTDGQKVQPFLKKDVLEIPDRLADKFISAFLIKASRRSEVVFSGFDVQDKPDSTKAILSLSLDLDHQPLFQLNFHYDQFIVNETHEQGLLAQVVRKNDKILIKRFQRKTKWEHQQTQLVIDSGMQKIRPSWFIPLDSPVDGDRKVEEMITWISTHKSNFDQLGIEIETHWNGQEFVAMIPEVITREMREEADWFDLYAVVKVGRFEIPFIRFKRNILERNPIFKLPDGKMLVLPESWFVKYADLFEFSDESENSIRLHRQHQGLLNGHPLLAGDINSRLAENQKKIYTGENGKSFSIPSGLTATLRDYQQKGFDWLCMMAENKLGACLADDMGLGKTIQVIALLQHAYEHKVPSQANQALFEAPQLDLFSTIEEPPVLPSLIVMAPSLIHNWEKELQKFAPSLKVKRHSGYRRTEQAGDLIEADVILTTYGVVRNDLDMLQKIEFGHIVLDESQLIKNMRSMSFQSVRKLNGQNRIVLTGTPVENSLTDLWSQLTFLQPGLLGSFNYFKNEFVVPIEQNKDEQKLARLQKIIRPFILRRTKEEVAPELPNQTRIIHYSNMDEEQKKCYEEQKSWYRNRILENVSREGIQKSQILILRGLTQLRKLAIHPVLDNPDYIGDSAKFNDVLIRLEELRHQNRKVLVFSQFVKHLQLFRKAFEENGTPYSWLTGEVPQLQRGPVIAGFEDHPGHKVFLIQLRTGGSGLNLTKADCVFLLDPWWNPAAEEQAIARSHRIGQHQPVFVWRFITKDTIEEKIMKLQEKKSRLAGDIISQANPLARISQEELEELFG